MRAALLYFIFSLSAALCSEGEQEQTSLYQTSASGLTGWTQATHRHSSGAWMNSCLEIKTAAGETKEFRAEYVFITGWRFIRGDTCVVIQSQNAHGPYYWQLFDIATGKLLDEFYRSKTDKVPDWVKDFPEEAKQPNNETIRLTS